MVKEVSKGVWYVEARYYDPALKYGTRKRLSGFVGTEKQARRKERELYQDLVKSSLTSTEKKRKKEPNILTFALATDIYLKYCRERGRASQSLCDALRLCKQRFGTIQLNNGNNEKVLTAFTAWREAEIGRLSSATINNNTAYIMAVLNLATKLGHIKSNPLTRIRFPILKQRQRERVLTAEEETALLDVVKTHRPFIFPLIHFLLIVPSRWRAELLNATTEQIDRRNNMIYIPIKDSKARIPIYKPIPQPLQPFFDSLPPDRKYIFFERRTGATTVHVAFRFCCKKAGLGDDVCLHTLRHCAITKLMQSELNNNAWDICAITGWTTPNPLKTYNHLERMVNAKKVKF
jgi:integrase